MKPITALLFIKANSERIPGKNFRSFNGRPLYTIILERLDRMPQISRVLVDSDSEEVLRFVSEKLQKGIAVPRPDHLLGGHISANELLAYDLSFTDSDYFFQTHCTNPLLTEKTIADSIEKYFNQLSEYDSLFSVTRIQNRVFYSNGNPVNHQLGKTLRTQDLDPVFEENASFFIFSRESFLLNQNRIGKAPFLYEISPLEGTDIDYENDFVLAELLERNRALFPDTF